MVAFRYPGEEKVHFLSGEWEKNQNHQNGFIIAPFSKGDDSYTLINTSPITSESFFKQINNVNQLAPVVISKPEYIEMGNKAMNLLKTSQLEKIVLSRVKEIPVTITFREIFDNLLAKYHDAFVYMAVGPFGIWYGASPEILVESDHKKLKTVALAGTQVYDQSKDSYNWGEKEKEEQKLVSDYISKILKHNGVNFQMSPPQTVRAGNVVHLKSIFECEVEDKEQVHQVLRDLHPTPAVAGIQTESAIKEIQLLEPHKRKFYTGYIGEISNSKTQLYVNLRCMEFVGNSAYLYVGGGYTKDSIVVSEWEETEYKSKVLQEVL